MRLLSLTAACLGLSLAAHAAEPGPMWGAIPGAALDLDLSQTFFPVQAGAFTRMTEPGETPDTAARRDALARDGLLVYLRRVDAMVACMNLPDDVRQPHCARMLTYLSPDFLHLEGRRGVTQDGRGGFATRNRDQLAAAGQARAFQLSGFYATRSRVRVLDDAAPVIIVVTCYFHDQRNDPLVVGTTMLPTGHRAVYRASVETITPGADGRLVIRQHVALDSDEMLVVGGCRTR